MIQILAEFGVYLFDWVVLMGSLAVLYVVLR